MSVPTDRTYLESHEWHKVDGDIVTIGITQFAADELTDVTYVSLPKVGDTISGNNRFGEIESVKATSELISPVSGEVVKVNEELKDRPELINENHYEDGWMLVVKMSNLAELDNLMTADEYKAYLQGR